MAAAYEVNISMTDDETFVLTLDMMRTDGTPFEVAEYAFEYSLKGCGGDILLDETKGIEVDSDTSTLTISPGVDYRLRRGNHAHGFRKRHLESGQVDLVFDGTVTVSEGNFNAR